jgi:hypothetical protein
MLGVFRAILAVLWLGFGAGMAAGCRRAPAPPVDLGGRPVTVPPPGVAATVVLFATTACPIMDRYAPELMRIHARFAREGVEFLLVFASPDDTPDQIQRYLGAYGYPFRALRDPAHVLVRRTGATVTPEAVVFDGHGEVRYRGRIDDRFIALGVARPAPARHDLEDALVALLHGRAPPQAVTPAVGCALN